MVELNKETRFTQDPKPGDCHVIMTVLICVPILLLFLIFASINYCRTVLADNSLAVCAAVPKL